MMTNGRRNDRGNVGDVYKLHTLSFVLIKTPELWTVRTMC
jgi:hypothetical protein